MSQKEYLKILLATKVHEYDSLDVNKLNNMEIKEYIDKLQKKSDKDSKIIDELVNIKSDDFFHIKDEFDNFRYFYKLSEKPKRMKIVELIISEKSEIQIKYIKKEKNKLINESIEDLTGTKEINQAYFKLDIDETKKLFELINILNFLERNGYNILNTRIFKDDCFWVGSNAKTKVINFTDDEVEQIKAIRKGELYLLDGDYNIDSIVELSEKLLNDYSIDNILNILKSNEVKVRIGELIQKYEKMLKDDSFLEKDWQNLFEEYHTIFSFVFGEHSINGFHSEVTLSQKSAYKKEKVEKVDFLIEKSNSITLIELKRHNEKIFEKNGGTRENIHMKKSVHTGVMQLMYYINPLKIDDEVKNKIRKRNFLIIGDQNHKVHDEFESDEKEKALSLYNNFLDKDIQVFTYRDVYNILLELQNNVINSS